MVLFIVIWVASVWAHGCALLETADAWPLSDQVSGRLRTRIEAAGTGPRIAVGEEVIHASGMLLRFYERRAYRPSWSGNDGLLPQVDSLIQAIHGADREGLRPGDYHLQKIETLLAEVRQAHQAESPLDPEKLVDFDLLLTDAFLIYAAHLSAGRIPPRTVRAEWLASRTAAGLAVVLQSALDRNRIPETLRSLLPSHPGYTRLRQALARYREIAAGGGWPAVPDGPELRKGTRGQRVVALRRRLRATGDLHHGRADRGDVFDEAMEEAVRNFQQRHGLDGDGVVGPAALAALNVPVQDRVRQIGVNMERWRWLPEDLGPRYILINIANFTLEVMKNGQLVVRMRVVVGTPDRPTPLFSGRITALVLNPSWHIPSSIAIEDQLPLIRADPDYLARHGIRVFQGEDAEASEIDPKSVDWSKVTEKNFDFRLRQEPGPLNPLGRVKFVFPNPYGVCLHDTPAQDLFAERIRAFSSGCIRVEKPIELAGQLLRGFPQWTCDDFRAAIDQGIEWIVRLSEPLRVHLVYWTSWVDQDGSLHFRRDIYGRDGPLEDALRRASPSS